MANENSADAAAASPPQCILVAVDFSEYAERALAWAFRIGEACGAKVHAVHALSLIALALGDEAHPEAPDFERRAKAHADAQLAALADAAKQKGHELQTHRADGNPADRIVHEAERLGADLIVMGTHGRSGLDRLMLGSVADRVLRTAHVPVLTVR
jgi:nucleotide-binding universal stress UspA family protein